MDRFAEEIRHRLDPCFAQDAITLLEHLFPLALRVQQIQPNFWPFCEAVDRNGNLFFYPRGEENSLPERRHEADLDWFVETGLRLDLFRSAGFVSPTVTCRSVGFCIELILQGERTVALFARTDRARLQVSTRTPLIR